MNKAQSLKPRNVTFYVFISPCSTRAKKMDRRKLEHVSYHRSNFFYEEGKQHMGEIDHTSPTFFS